MVKKQIIVCGGAGFLSSHFCDGLVKEGHDVICLDNLYIGSPDNIQSLVGSAKNFRFIHHDINAPLKNHEADEIYNPAYPESSDSIIEEIQWWLHFSFKEGLIKTITYFDGILRDSLPAGPGLNQREKRLNAYARAM